MRWAEAQRPFPQENELKEKQDRLDQLNIELNMDKPENDYCDNDIEESEKESRDDRVITR